MKIALINNRFSASHGGLERYACNLTKMLLTRGHEVHLYAQAIQDVPEQAQKHLVHVFKKPSWLRILIFVMQVKRQISSEQYDIVYGLTKAFPLDVYRMGDGVHRHWLAIRFPNPVWRMINCMINFTYAMNLFMESRVFKTKNCRIWVSNSKLCQKHAEQYLNVSPEQLRVIYNGVDQTEFNPVLAKSDRHVTRGEMGLGEDDIAITYIANNWRRKGLGVLLKAISRLGQRGKNIHVLVVGRGNPKKFDNLIKTLNLAQQVHFLGTTKNVIKYYGAGDLFVLPTKYDPFSNVCLEAMACGLPVITTLENGASEIIDIGKTGYVQQDPDSDEELSKLLAECLDISKLAQLGDSAFKVSQGFTLEKNFQETFSLFQELVFKTEAPGYGR